MRSRIRRGFGAIASMAMAITLLAVSMTAPVVSSTADFSIFNSGWNGTSNLAVLTYQAGKFAPTFRVESSGTDITVAQTELTDFDLGPATDSLVVIGPTKQFTAAEGELVGDFVRNGGILLLADDFGTGNGLLAEMGATSRFSGHLVMDLAFEKQPEFPVCFDLEQDPMTKNVSTLLLNYPSSLVLNTSVSEVVGRTSIASWLDTSGNRLQEPGEQRGPFPVLARERLGLGAIILLSDPSLLINGMSGNLDNGVFATNLMNSISQERSSVYFDESHRDFFDPVAVTLQITGEASTEAKAMLVILAFLLALWMTTDLVDRGLSWTIRRLRFEITRLLSFILPRSWRRKAVPPPKALSDEEMVRLLAEMHPDWRHGLVRYLLRERERHRAKLERKGS